MVLNLNLPLLTGVITAAGAQVTDNIAAIVGISALLIAAIIFNPFNNGELFALVMSGIAGMSALAGYEIGKRQS